MSYLIDPVGIIIERNIRADELSEKLKDIL